MTTTRRSFIKTTGQFAGLACLGSQTLLIARAATQKQYKAAIIGRTGRGDYGHGFDVIFRGLENVSVEAIADEHPDGLKKAAERSGAKRQYRDYREMLEKEKPDLVSIAPRQPDCHKDMALAAVNVGAHIWMEKPMTETVEEADAIVEAAERKGVKVAIGHVRKVMPDFRRMKDLLDEGFAGTVLEVRAQGKQDSRVGGEDLIVLGVHDFDFVRWCFGDPLWCFATVLQDGRPATPTDVRKGSEPMLVAGDTIRSTFAFPKNLQFYWDSVKAPDHWNTRHSKRENWVLEIRGTQRIMMFQSSYGMGYLDSPFPAHKDATAIWKELPEPKSANVPAHEKHPIKNLIHAIEHDTQPLCSARDGRWAIEMVAAVYESHKQRRPVELPLKNRQNPLRHW
ncbi:MAG: Gfo/Idh/MocA family oxidoreductase [Verrucomicrobia bacterium]|nr:Gfo/Idh/MocA family oxidoreductase [Verrucomicrobiota bacterium]